MVETLFAYLHSITGSSISHFKPFKLNILVLSFDGTLSTVDKNSSGDEIADVNFLTTISHTRRPTSKYRKRDKPTSLNKLDDR